MNMNVIPTQFRGVPVHANLEGASQETYSGGCQLKKSPCMSIFCSKNCSKKYCIYQNILVLQYLFTEVFQIKSATWQWLIQRRCGCRTHFSGEEVKLFFNNSRNVLIFKPIILVIILLEIFIIIWEVGSIIEIEMHNLEYFLKTGSGIVVNLELLAPQITIFLTLLSGMKR